MKSYDYAARQGLFEASWEQIETLSRRVAEALAREKIDAVIGVARAGLIAAARVACALQLDLHPIQLTRREADRVVRDEPLWKVDVPEIVQGKRVAIVDEIADTGRTLALAAERARERGASAVVTATLVAHSWAEPPPDVVGQVSDELLVFPWDAQVFVNGRWQLHPELQDAVERAGD